MVAAAALLLASCGPDLSNWTVVPPGVDAGDWVPPPQRDGGGDPPPTGGGPCGSPTLYASVEDLNIDGDEAGWVIRYALQEEGATRCGDVRAGDAIDGQPYVVAANGAHLVVASPEGVQGVDPIGDRLVWRQPAMGTPNDAFMWLDPDRGENLFAVAWNTGTACFSGSIRCDVRQLSVYTSSGEVARSWTVGSGGDVPVSGARAMTRSPHRPSRILTMNPQHWAAAEVDPIAGTLFRDPDYVTLGTGHFPETLYAVTEGTTARLAWFGSADGADSVFYLRDDTGGSDLRVSGPIERCGCEMHHLVPDPTRVWGMIGLCEVDGIERDIVRFRSTGTDCETLLDGASLGRQRISYLAISPQ